MTPRRAISALTTAARRFRRAESGTSTVEFALSLPVMITLFLASFDLAVMNIRQLMIGRGLDLAVRDLRLGTWPNLDTDTLKQAVCDETGGFIPDCVNELMIELVPVPQPGWSLPDPQATCVDRDAAVQPAVTFNPGAQNEMMIVRACVLVDPIVPGSALALRLQDSPGDGVALVASSGFVNEPLAGGSL